MGKTILANQTTPPNEISWITFRASIPNRPSGTEPLLDLISAQIDSDSNLRCVVLDDMDFSPERFAAYKDSLAAVIYSAKTRGVKILITGQKSLPATFQALFGTVSFESITIPRFTKDEIQSVVEAFGCPAEMAKHWAYLVELSSLGHPQLVHARVIELADQGWRQPTQADILSPSPGVDETRRETAQLLGARDATGTGILGRLSLFLGGFRRDQAIKVIEAISGITLPAQQFDKLIGPWIEPIAQNYFQISPLLTGIGNTMWSEQEIKTIREDIGIAILACGKLTLTEAENLIAQAVLSGSDPLAQQVLPNLVTLPLEGRRALAKTVSWVAALDRNVIRFSSENSRLLLLNLQFVVALEAAHEIVPKLLAEIRALPDTSDNKMMKIWSYGQLLFNEEYASIELRLEALVEMIELQHSSWDDLETADTANFAHIADAAGLAEIGYEYGLLGNILFRCKSYHDVRSVFEFLKKNHGGMDLMRRILIKDPYLAFSLVQKTWLTEENNPQPDWDGVLRLLGEIETFGQEHNLPILVEASLCSQMIVHTDYLKDGAASQAVFDRSFTAVPAPTPYMLNGRAKLLANQKKWRKALEIWDRINPIRPTPSSHLLPLVSMQEAAVAASHFDWEKGADIYLAAEKYAEQTKSDDMVLRTGLLADAALLLWRGNRVDEAARLLWRVLENLEKLSNTPDELREFKLHKCVGQLLLNLAYDENPAQNPGVYLTPFGYCSSFDVPPAFKNLPVGRPELSWVLLYNLSAIKPFPEDLKAKLEQKLRNQLSPPGRALFFQRLLEHRFRESNFAELGSLMQELGTATVLTQTHRQNPTEPLPAAAFAPLPNATIDSMVPWILDAAFAARWLCGMPDWAAAVEALESSSMGLPIEAAVQARLATFRSFSGSELSDVERTMMKSLDPRERLDAALTVLARNRSNPTHMLRATLTVLICLETNPFRAAVGGHVEAAITKAWSKICDQQDVPIGNQQSLREACAPGRAGLQKAARIALAALKAVGIEIDTKTLGVLEKMASAPSFD